MVKVNPTGPTIIGALLVGGSAYAIYYKFSQQGTKAITEANEDAGDSIYIPIVILSIGALMLVGGIRGFKNA